MKRTIIATSAALILLAMPALADGPTPAAPPEPLDPALAMAAIKSIEADQAFRDAQADVARRQAQEKIAAVRKQCGQPCGGSAPQAQAEPAPAAPEAPKP